MFFSYSFCFLNLILFLVKSQSLAEEEYRSNLNKEVVYKTTSFSSSNILPIKPKNFHDHSTTGKENSRLILNEKNIILEENNHSEEFLLSKKKKEKEKKI